MSALILVVHSLICPMTEYIIQMCLSSVKAWSVMKVRRVRWKWIVGREGRRGVKMVSVMIKS